MKMAETNVVAVNAGRGQVAVEERPLPSPGPGEVLVEVSHCGICGSDIHMIVDGWGETGRVEGHEYTGTIAAVGPAVEGWLVGDVVVGGPAPKCGHCRRCLEGKPSQCENRDKSVIDAHDGAFARYTVVDARQLLHLPEGLGAREAALAEPLAVALHGITRSGIAAATGNPTTMVFGAGPIGVLTVGALKALGIGPISVVEPNHGRQQLAERFGADRVLQPSDLEIFPMWEPERISADAVDFVFECSGKKAAMEAGYNQLLRGGVLTLVGAGVEPPTFDPNRMILNELHVCGSFIYDADGFERALEMLASGMLPVDGLIEPDDVTLDRLGDALTGLAKGQIAGKVLVVPRLSSQG